MKKIPKNTRSSNDSKYKNNDFYAIYEMFLIEHNSWNLLEVEYLHIHSNHELKPMQQKLRQRNNTWNFFNLIAATIFHIWSSGKKDKKNDFPLLFLFQIQILSIKFQMSWSNLMAALAQIFTHHKWSPIYDILISLHKNQSQWLDKITTVDGRAELNDQRFKHIKDAENSNLKDGENCTHDFNQIKTFNYDNFIDKIYWHPFKAHSNETYYQRTNSWHTKANKKVIDIRKFINQSITHLQKSSEAVNISVVTLWFNCQELNDRKIIIKSMTDGFFALLKKHYKNSKVFYIRQVFYDNLMGMQVDLVLISNKQLNSSDHGYFAFYGNEICKLWGEFCLKQKYQDITVLTNNKICTKNINNYIINHSFITSLDIYCYLVYGRTCFMDINLPMIRSFSKGKLHEN